MRQKIFADPDAALAGLLRNGLTIMSGGFGLSGNPESLIDVVRRKNANGVVFLSGDVHYAELSKLDVNVPYTLWDLTSSGLTEEWRVPTPNANRVSGVLPEANFGFIDIDWQGPSTRLTLGIADAKGKTRMSWVIELASLAGGAPR